MVLMGGMGERYCSQKCYDAGGATVTTHLLRNWTGDCSVCHGDVALRVGGSASMVCWKPGLFLFHCGSPSCVAAVRNAVRQTDVCPICGAGVRLERKRNITVNSEGDVSRLPESSPKNIGCAFIAIMAVVGGIGAAGATYVYDRPRDPAILLSVAAAGVIGTGFLAGLLVVFVMIAFDIVQKAAIIKERSTALFTFGVGAPFVMPATIALGIRVSGGSTDQIIVGVMVGLGIGVAISAFLVSPAAERNTVLLELVAGTAGFGFGVAGMFVYAALFCVGVLVSAVVNAIIRGMF